MLVVLILLAVVSGAVSARLLAYAVALPRLTLKRHLRDIRDYGYDARVPAQVATRARLALALRRRIEGLGAFAIANAPALRPLPAARLAAAGLDGSTPELVHGYRLVAAAIAGLLATLIMASAGGAPVLGLVLVLGTAALGWQLPAVLIRGRGTRRLAEIDRELPELIDLLIATVEAGQGFGGSLKLVSGRLRGPLGDEVRLTIGRQNLGISTSEALEDMLGRCDTLAMRAFVRTVVRGESLGLSIAPILRELTIDMRRRRRQAAQERMHKAPVKILFPLMFLIMPALGIVLFYPAAYSLMTGLSGIH